MAMDSNKYWLNGEPFPLIEDATKPTGDNKYWLNGEPVLPVASASAPPATDTTRFFLLFEDY